MTSTDHPLVSIESSFTAFAHGRYIHGLEARAREILKQIRSLTPDNYNPLTDLEPYLDRMDDLREKYVSHLEQIFVLVPRSNTLEDRERAVRIEKILDECRTKLLQLNSEKTVIERDELALKYESVPRFSGKVEEWVKFRSKFRNRVIENPSEDAEKQQVFQLKVSREIVEPSCKSVKILWTELCEKFDRRATNFHVFKLVNQRKMSMQSSVEDVSNLVQESEDHIWALQELGYDMNPLSEILLGCLLKSNTPRSIQRDLYKAERALTWTNITTLLLDRAYNGKFRSRSKNDCFYCQNSHFLRECRDFLNLPFEERFDLVIKTWELCFLCLSSVHIAKNCNTLVRCHICCGKHNSALHPRDGNKKKMGLFDKLLK